MLIPSIDLMSGRAVQLVGGRELKIDAGDPRPIAERFALVGEIAVVDLDAALGRGDNAAVIRDLLRIAPCRVGGGIRSVAQARAWLDAGATKVVLGTAATPEILRALPRERVVAALDGMHGEVVVEGWQRGTGQRVLERIAALRELVGGFLVTFVEREGRLSGTDLDAAKQIVAASGDCGVTIAGGITTLDEIAALDALGADAQLGMALYADRLHLADAVAAPLIAREPDGLWPTIVADERGVALGLAWSNRESLRAAVEQRRGVYHSRRRGLWVKGESSGATQALREVALDCDRDALRFTVAQAGAGFCHRETYSCWGPARGLTALERTLANRRVAAPAGSYAARLFNDPDLLRSKLLEEAGELLDATDPAHIADEAADLLFFTLARLAAAGVPLADVEAALDRRALRVTRRPGDAKPAASTEAAQ